MLIVMFSRDSDYESDCSSNTSSCGDLVFDEDIETYHHTSSSKGNGDNKSNDSHRGSSIEDHIDDDGDVYLEHTFDLRDTAGHNLVSLRLFTSTSLSLIINDLSTNGVQNSQGQEVERFVTDNEIISGLVYDRLYDLELPRLIPSQNKDLPIIDLMEGTERKPRIMDPMMRTRPLEVTREERDAGEIYTRCELTWDEGDGEEDE